MQPNMLRTELEEISTEPKNHFRANTILNYPDKNVS